MPEIPTSALGPTPDPHRAETVTAADSNNDSANRQTELANCGIGHAISARTLNARRGRFTIERSLAEGGLGRISLARDVHLRRQVAIKEMRPDRRHSETRRRFLVEAEITGRLEHPGIVPVYALEEDDDGEPYYVMRYIQGRTFSDAIRAHHREPTALAFRDLLQRFVSVCQAVAFAHSKGILHRDLKPANIMLGEFGETLVVDWGLAKEVASPDKGADSIDRTTPTSEPIDSSALTVPPAAAQTQHGEAVGTPPYMAPEQARGEWDQVGPAADVFALGAILYELLTEQPPYRGADASEILGMAAAADYRPPRHVRADVPRALEAICLKALAPKPAKRYESAQDLAADVSRWLADEPVSAYAEPWHVRLKRWRRRHPGVVGSATAAVLMAVLALGGVTALVVRHADQLSGAYAAEHAAKEDAQQQHEQARIKEAEAKAEFQAAREAVNQYFDLLQADADLNRTDLHPLQLRLFEKTLPFYERLTKLRTGDADVERDQALAFHHLGRVRRNMGQLADAQAAYERSAQIWEHLASDSPQAPRYRIGLANTYNDLGAAFSIMGKHAEARSAFAHALALWEILAAEPGADPSRRDELAKSHNNLGIVLAQLGKSVESEAAFRQALNIQEKLAAEFPAVAGYRQDLAGKHSGLGTLFSMLGKHSEAEAAFCRAIEIDESLVADFSATPQYRQHLASTYRSLGGTRASLGHGADADAAYQKALAIQEELATDFPTIPDYRRDVANTHRSLADLRAAQRRHEEAEAAFRRALAIQEKLAADFPLIPEYRQDLAASEGNLGLSLKELGKRPEAEAAYRQAILALEKLAVEFPAIADYRRDVADIYHNLANLLIEMGKRSDAEAAFRQALALREKLAQDFPNVPRYHLSLAAGYIGIGGIVSYQHRPAETSAWLTKAIDLLQPLLAKEPRLVLGRWYLRNAYMGRAEAEDQLGRPADAVADWDRALAVNDQRRDLPAIRKSRAVSLARCGEHAKAVSEADALAALPDIPGSALYDLACVCALAAASVKDDAKLQDRYAGRAVAILRQAVGKGYKDIEHLKKDEDLAALREREDYKKLVQGLAPQP